MFDFLLDMGNYEDRKVDCHEDDTLIVDTARCSDGRKPYETAVQHPEYNSGKWVIVEAYDTKEEAQEGHNKWVAKMTSASIPPSLKDCGNAGVSQLLDAFGGEMEFARTIDAS